VGDVTDELLLHLQATLLHVNVKMLSEGNHILHSIGIRMMKTLCICPLHLQDSNGISTLIKKNLTRVLSLRTELVTDFQLYRQVNTTINKLPRYQEYFYPYLNYLVSSGILSLED